MPVMDSTRFSVIALGATEVRAGAGEVVADVAATVAAVASVKVVAVEVAVAEAPVVRVPLVADDAPRSPRKLHLIRPMPTSTRRTACG